MSKKTVMICEDGPLPWGSLVNFKVKMEANKVDRAKEIKKKKKKKKI